MKSIRHNPWFAALLGVTASCAATPDPDKEKTDRSEAPLFFGSGMLAPALNEAGLAQSATSTGAIDTSNPYFQSLGTNGRTCGSCHLAGEGWTIVPSGLRMRFELTGGLDPVFLPHDGANA